MTTKSLNLTTSSLSSSYHLQYEKKQKNVSRALFTAPSSTLEQHSSSLFLANVTATTTATTAPTPHVISNSAAGAAAPPQNAAKGNTIFYPTGGAFNSSPCLGRLIIPTNGRGKDNPSLSD